MLGWFSQGDEIFSQDYTQMLSAFISCLFEIGLFLSNEKMREVNKHRESHKWGKHLSMKEATEIQSTDKEQLRDQLTLIKYFDVGINGAGYWNYKEMP